MASSMDLCAPLTLSGAFVNGNSVESLSPAVLTESMASREARWSRIAFADELKRLFIASKASSRDILDSGCCAGSSSWELWKGMVVDELLPQLIQARHGGRVRLFIEGLTSAQCLLNQPDLFPNQAQKVRVAQHLNLSSLRL